MAYKPKTPFNVPAKLLKPTRQTVSGVSKNVYPNPSESDEIINISFRTFGGAEREINGLYVIENTATVEPWYRPDIHTNA